MKRHYPWLWFDLDNTLFDYNLSEISALKRAFQSVNVPFEEEYLESYRQINRGLWRALEQREITSDVLRTRRFELLVDTVRLNCSPEEMSVAYVESLSTCAELIDGAYDVLRALHETCRFAVVTNGLQAVQRRRLANSPIREFITDLIISEEVGASKPDPAFFTAAFARLGYPPKSDVLIIGDSITSDIQGGSDSGIDTCWYNPTADPRPVDIRITYEISSLRELLDTIV